VLIPASIASDCSLHELIANITQAKLSGTLVQADMQLNRTLIHVEMLWKQYYTWLGHMHRSQIHMEMLYE
jgi:hypothetical protein